MKIGLAQYKFINKDITFNLAQMEKALKEAAGNVDLLCFGEAFLQGFDSLSWKYEEDKTVAVTKNSPEIQTICNWSKEYSVAIAFGYIEREDDTIYSSYAFVEDGKVTHNYKRMSVGWKESPETDNHYKEGEIVETFSFMGRDFEIALCGDLWDVTWDKFVTNAIVLWPVYVSFTLEEWPQEEIEYTKQAEKISERVLMVNSLSREPVSHGGTFDFKNGAIQNKLPYDVEDVLIVEL